MHTSCSNRGAPGVLMQTTLEMILWSLVVHVALM